jgi:hypothetical protein
VEDTGAVPAGQTPSRLVVSALKDACCISKKEIQLLPPLNLSLELHPDGHVELLDRDVMQPLDMSEAQKQTFLLMQIQTLLAQAAAAQKEVMKRIAEGRCPVCGEAGHLPGNTVQ